MFWANCRPEPERRSLVQARLGNLVDAEATRAVRTLCEVEYIRQSAERHRL